MKQRPHSNFQAFDKVHNLYNSKAFVAVLILLKLTYLEYFHLLIFF